MKPSSADRHSVLGAHVTDTDIDVPGKSYCTRKFLLATITIQITRPPISGHGMENEVINSLALVRDPRGFCGQPYGRQHTGFRFGNESAPRSNRDRRKAGDPRGGTDANNFPFLDAAGAAATFSTAGFVDLKNPFHVPQGENGRSCESCHLPQTGWSVIPAEVELRFWLTKGRDPIFNLLDANSPTADVSTLQARYASYSMLRKGLFRRGGALPATAEFEIVAFDDPLGAGGSLTSFQAFRRPLATANFHIARNVGWHDQNTNGSGDVHAGLVSQAAGNITGGQQGAPATPSASSDSQLQRLWLRAQYVNGCVWKFGGTWRAQAPVRSSAAGRPSTCIVPVWPVPGSSRTGPRSPLAQIARGKGCSRQREARFAVVTTPHNGSKVSGALFDSGASRAEFASPACQSTRCATKLRARTPDYRPGTRTEQGRTD